MATRPVVSTSLFCQLEYTTSSFNRRLTARTSNPQRPRGVGTDSSAAGVSDSASRRGGRRVLVDSPTSASNRMPSIHSRHTRQGSPGIGFLSEGSDLSAIGRDACACCAQRKRTLRISEKALCAKVPGHAWRERARGWIGSLTESPRYAEG